MNTIVQFVQITTRQSPAGFREKWVHMKDQFENNLEDVLLKKIPTKDKTGSVTYLSLHRFDADNFNFIFKKERKQKDSQEASASVRQMGGYRPLKTVSKGKKQNGNLTVILFLENGDTDVDRYRDQVFHGMNIYEAYFENCSYQYVLEYSVPGKDAKSLVRRLKEMGADASVFEECVI